MKETEKAHRRRYSSPLFHSVFKGHGIDIGGGNNPLDPSKWEGVSKLDTFDVVDGDAQYITEYIKPLTYDFVYSSHCLEHMINPFSALIEWWSILKVGGGMVLSVPDEDLYEQGVFPSRYNSNHSWTFSIYKSKSWSPNSVSVLNLIKYLSSCQVMKVELVDTNYDYSLEGVDQSRSDVEVSIEVVLKKRENEWGC